MFRRIFPTAVALALALPLSTGAAQQPTPPAAQPDSAAHPASMVVLRKAALKYGPIEVPGFRSGMQIAVLSGDPAKPAPYTIRLRFPAGYAFPAHFHPNDENVTVLSGKFFLAMGEKSNRAALKAYGPGDYLFAPAKQPHFGRVQGPTVIQLHGMGPFEITVVEQIAGATPRQ